jgi:hypothetical protein
MADEKPIRYSFLEFDSETVKRCLKVIRNLGIHLGNRAHTRLSINSCGSDAQNYSGHIPPLHA